MPKLLDIRQWQLGCHSLIVGIHLNSETVERIWVMDDGAMLFRGLLHYPRVGRTAVGEAMTTFGLFRLRMFSAWQKRQARAYAARLELELEPDDEP